MVPIDILQALNMRTCLNQLSMSSVTYFISQATREFASAKTNAIEMYGEDSEKNEGEWTGEAEIRTRKKLWH